MVNFDKNRYFYENSVRPLIRSRFPEFEDRIAVGIAGEGSDCFGYDDVISRDHDFGTGVCLWVEEEDMKRFGYQLSIAYNELVDRQERAYYTDRLRERRGVMTIHDFYSNILRVDCDTAGCRLHEQQWLALDHDCLATAVNGEVFRDDLGTFSAFRDLLLGYYPERVWRIRLAEQLHRFAAALQVNYARCMTRKDSVAAGICKNEGVMAAMQLFFLIRRVYPPYYKWTFRALTELEDSRPLAEELEKLSVTGDQSAAWEDVSYHPNRLNIRDEVVNRTETVAGILAAGLREAGLITGYDPYLETYVKDVLQNIP